MIDYKSIVSDAVRAVTIDEDGSFYWFGDRTWFVQDDIAPRQLSRKLATRLEQRLYWNFYTTGTARPLVQEDQAEEADAESFVNELSCANHGRGPVQDGWRFVSRLNRSVIVRKGGVTLNVPIARVIRERNGVVKLRTSKESRCSPGFYTAIGDVTPRPLEPLVRVYWNVRPEGAATFVEAVTTILNRNLFAFRAKVLSDPLDFDRCDAAVIYVMRGDWSEVRKHLTPIYRSLRGKLDDATPALTKRLGRGMAIAEDPLSDQSFGGHRCRLIASALLGAQKVAKASPEARVEHVIGALAKHRVRIAEPFLNPGSRDIYQPLSL